ncbi:OmpA family protein [Sabulicella glaciei]|uniref:OmpA family protein n=1 Tax=Sabulicella glaciei TaxID=2984948 RepID=A0ABT3NZ89_9PROT|nr:CpaD family pilus assembly lipoprotein [Roseococcus sp. MDT2-1-1]MCW8087471.1 OmpA family protein [Roseococcus sp. MDT2-1-1]
MIQKPLFAALAVTALLAACANPAPPARPVAPQSAPVAAAPPPPAAPTGDGRVTHVRFDPTSSTLPDEAMANLGPAVDRLNDNPRTRMTITTYANRQGTQVARSRAQAIRQAMIERGIPANRIRVVNAGMARGAEPDMVQVAVR